MGGCNAKRVPSCLLLHIAGHFTLKELEIIKAQYKHSIDFAISDRAIQVSTSA